MTSVKELLTGRGLNSSQPIPSSFQSYPSSLRDITEILASTYPDLKKAKLNKAFYFEEENAQGISYGYDDIWFLSSEKRLIKYAISDTNLAKPDVRKVRRLKRINLNDCLKKITGTDTLFNGTPRDAYKKARDAYKKAVEGLSQTNNSIKQIEKINSLQIKCDLLKRYLEGDRLPLLKQYYDHIGDISYHDGLLFAPIRSRLDSCRHMLLILSKNLEVIGYTGFSRTHSDAWCAVNPWNSYIYLGYKHKAHTFSAYDLSGIYALYREGRLTAGAHIGLPRSRNSFILKKANGTKEKISDIQGVHFSTNGRVYVSNYNVLSDGIYNNMIQIYDSLTGWLISSKKDIDFDGIGDEIEGITTHPSGIIYIAVADNDILDSSDEFYLYTYHFTDPKVLV